MRTASAASAASGAAALFPGTAFALYVDQNLTAAFRAALSKTLRVKLVAAFGAPVSVLRLYLTIFHVSESSP